MGKVMFQLERVREDEVFWLRFEANPWVTVDPDGAVRVKKEWDQDDWWGQDDGYGSEYWGDIRSENRE